MPTPLRLQLVLLASTLPGARAWGFCNDKNPSCGHWAKEGECAGKKDPLLLTTRKPADLAPGEVLHADPLQMLAGEGAMTAPHRPKPANFAIETHGDHVFGRGRKIPIDAGTLRNICDAPPRLAQGGAEYAHMAG